MGRKKRSREDSEQQDGEDFEECQLSSASTKKIAPAHLLEEGAAKVSLRPRNEGGPLKVAQTVLRKRSQNLQEQAARAKKIRQLKRSAPRREHQQTIKSAQFFVKRARLRSLDNTRVIRARKTPAKKPRCVKEKPLILVVRNGREGGVRDVQSVFKKLGLRRRFTCTVMRNDEESMQQLKVLKPFVFYGYPTYATLRRLFLTRGRLRVSEKEVADLSDNTKVESCLGRFGLFCVEDLIHELWTTGPHFEDVKAHLCAFQLGDLKKVEGLEGSRRQTYGNLRDSINEKIWMTA